MSNAPYDTDCWIIYCNIIHKYPGNIILHITRPTPKQLLDSCLGCIYIKVKYYCPIIYEILK